MFDLDEVLGRAELKDRIADLEDELEHMERRYEAEADRRSDAVTARQEAEAEVNRLEDRIAQLEGELERVESDDAGIEVRRREQLRGGRLETVLERLQSVRTDSEGALTAILGGDDDRETLEDLGVEDVLSERTALLEDASPCVCCLDDAGLVSVALEPPVLPSAHDSGWHDRFRLEREWFLPTGRYAIALVRTDLFALGIYHGNERLEYHGFESDVKGSHSKGGFSQARFERIRNEQIDTHLDRCDEALAKHIGSRLEQADGGGRQTSTVANGAGAGGGDDENSGIERLFLVGQRGVVDTLADEIDLEPAATAAVDATGDPKPALEDAVHSFWTTELHVL
ncbi:Vms1/Ankzf1 family peptidyl-tRNA hydrolase [Natronolimnobius baerhuensis]|uniref:Actinobacteria/chloroflexi VLRF1 release factor domain-containing protein n=1 Tax=Natronolimnobius baerhuensis TaxID=253108 RepID=A0A202E670_9EURY|nr:Vms1/Ankzf1 family peptidyl-tRNA hydrolase [Natronolimnobius baerhuensis]OVE83729.1 hypothetical protein B2G88_15005 [Natronolimnobius baerhuensis]